MPTHDGLSMALLVDGNWGDIECCFYCFYTSCGAPAVVDGMDGLIVGSYGSWAALYCIRGKCMCGVLYIGN